MKKCKTCRWWQKMRAGESETCNCEESEFRFDEMDAECNCVHWSQRLEQDGDATWYME